MAWAEVGVGPVNIHQKSIGIGQFGPHGYSKLSSSSKPSLLALTHSSHDSLVVATAAL